MGGIAAGDRNLVEAIRQKIIHLGASLGAMDAWLAAIGLPTLPLRMNAHSRTAQAVAEYLATSPAVAAVHHPGLPSHPQHDIARELYPAGTGGMLSFHMAGGVHAARRFLANAAPLEFAPSLADVATTVSYPIATSHQGLPDTALADLHVGVEMIRLSAGIEEPADVIADLDAALAATM